jgi:hypothetical protein
MQTNLENAFQNIQIFPHEIKVDFEVDMDNSV